ncbi:MAG: EF-hand domain-containing protein [Methyloceanibacter sp.]|uniref:EF-hand domain-containing protein n=1 Tax=Methyloceanibacter sp. TaxID=1965321 RepID=UPI003D6D00F4
MRTFAILTGLALLVVSGYASAATMTSGRPSAVLDKKQCKTVWHAAVPDGRYLYRQNAAPFIVNFALADGPDQDGRISKREFKKACKKGLVKYPFR